MISSLMRPSYAIKEGFNILNIH